MPTMPIAGGSLFFEIAGHGPGILMIQGTGVTGSAWSPQVENLRENYTCVTFDNRGIGRSQASAESLSIQQMAADALALLDHLKWDSVHVVGHSMGGLIAEQLALTAPDRVRSLSLLCTFASGSEAARLTPATIWMGIRTRVGTADMRRRAFLEMLFPANWLQAQDRTAVAARVAELVGRDLADSPPIMMKQLQAMRAFNRSAELATISVPTLVVSARHDPIATASYGRALARLIPGSHYVEIPDASHGVTIQEPAKVNALLLSHFDGRKDRP